MRIKLLLITLLISVALQAQHTDLWLLEENLEQLAIESDATDWEDELEELSYRLREKINLNTATKEQLEMFPFLSDIQIENLLAYIYLHGEMETIYELQLVEEMDKETIERLLPFVRVSKSRKDDAFPSWKRVLKFAKQEAMARFDVPFYARKGYEKDYLGPSLYHSLRYSFRYGERIQAGVTGEKDAGEPFFALHNKKGYDHYAYYLLLKEWGRLQTLAVGTYKASFGQGLVLGNAFGLGKSFSLATAEYRLDSSWRASAFYSHRNLDGVVKDGEITSIYKTGLHRSESEVEKIHTLVMQVAGGNVSYENLHLKVGVTGIYYFFDCPYEPNLREYAKYNLRGNHFYNVSIDYNYRWGKFAWVGEAAKGKHGYALLNRWRYQLNSDYKFMLIHRWYVAAEVSPFVRWKFFVAADFFSFPWWKYRISKPSQGTDVMFQATFTPDEHWSMYANHRYKRKERDVTGTSGEIILPTHHHKTRFRLNYTSVFWGFRTTFDYNHFSQPDLQYSQGWLVTQSCSFQLPFTHLTASVQGTYFHTDDYDSRVYAYEKGLLYTFYTPSFNGRGFRYSAHLRYDFRDWLMLITKFGQTIYQDRDEISSGKDLIKGNKKTDLQVQIRIKF